MAPFALPVPAYMQGVHQAKRKKEKEDDTKDPAHPSPSPAPSFSFSSQGGALFSSQPTPGTPSSSSSSRLPADAINPLSHSPGTLHQLATAGLGPSAPVPPPPFPHAPVAADRTTKARRRGRGASSIAATSGNPDAPPPPPGQEEEAGKARPPLPPRLRHLASLTAILHRCVAEADYARARRAFALLTRSPGVDVRLGGLWALGAEVLMRSGSGSGSGSSSSSASSPPPPPADEAAEPAEDGVGEGAQPWGGGGGPAATAAARAYLSALIATYPAESSSSSSSSSPDARDFWPALLGIEVYGIAAELRHSLQQLEHDEEEDFGDPMDEDDDDDEDALAHARAARRWAAHDEARGRTAAVAARLDELLLGGGRAWRGHAALLRLRGHVALFAADLGLPARLAAGVPGVRPPLTTGGRLRGAAADAAERRAVERWREERARARGFFRRCVEVGGEVEGWVRRFVEEDEEDEEEEGEGEGGEMAD
ncbi:hypothetical protein F4780DRAFT_792102 [Xylariomycetidae sp. FL0641]|nr:hypothetical protein F4780DRAFT_792102 [Xylariomycetidae sp. FL0641]